MVSDIKILSLFFWCDKQESAAEILVLCDSKRVQYKGRKFPLRNPPVAQSVLIFDLQQKQTLVGLVAELMHLSSIPINRSSCSVFQTAGESEVITPPPPPQKKKKKKPLRFSYCLLTDSHKPQR